MRLFCFEGNVCPYKKRFFLIFHLYFLFSLAFPVKMWYNISPSAEGRYRGIAQQVEQRSPKPRAEGSIPSTPAKACGLKRSAREKQRFSLLFFIFRRFSRFFKIRKSSEIKRSGTLKTVGGQELNLISGILALQ